MCSGVHPDENKCCFCGKTVDSNRAVTLVDMGLPVSHYECSEANEEPVAAYMDYGHKTGGEVVVAHGAENVRRADRIHRRSR